jgi:hypothetical protein
MGSPKIWSAEELENMSAKERHAIVRGGFEADLGKVSPDLLARTRRRIEAHMASNQDAQTPDR